MGQHLLAVADPNRDLQLVNNIERVLNSFEFLEQELDRSETNGSHNDQQNGVGSGTRCDPRKAQQPGKSSLDNSITTNAGPNPTDVTSSRRFEQTAGRTASKNPTASSTTNKSSTGETKNTLAPNCPQRDLTFLAPDSSQQQHQKTTPSPSFEVANLDDYDDIQTVAANCNVTEYLNQNNLANNSGSSVGSDKTADKSGPTTNGLSTSAVDTLASGSVSVLNGLAAAERSENESPTSSPVKENRFVKEDCKNNKINKLKTLFRPVKVGLADKQKRAKEASKQGNLAAKLLVAATAPASATTTDLIKKENKERKDDSQLVGSHLAGENNLKANLANGGTNLVKEDLKTAEVVNGKFVAVAGTGKQATAAEVPVVVVGSEKEKKITANDQLVDHLIGQNLRAKIDSENNGNSQSDNYGGRIAAAAAAAADQAVVLVEQHKNEQAALKARIEILNTKSAKSGKSNASRSSSSSNRSVQSEKCAEQTDESNKHRAPGRSGNQQTGSQQTGVVSQTNAFDKTPANQPGQRRSSQISGEEQSSTELELNSMQPDEQMIANQSIVTPTSRASAGSKLKSKFENKLENKNDTKLDKKSNQAPALKRQQAAAINELNHASRTVRRTPINQQNGLSTAAGSTVNSSTANSTVNQTANQIANQSAMPLVVRISTRPKVIELTKSSDLKSKLGTSIVRATGNALTANNPTGTINAAKLKRTPSDQSSSSVNSNGSAAATVTGLHKKSGGSNKSNAVISNNCQAAAKSANQIRCKTMSPAKQQRCPTPSKNETTTAAAVVNGGAISKSIGSQLKANSTAKVLNASRPKIQTASKAAANSTESKQPNRELDQQAVVGTLKNSQNRKPTNKPTTGSNLSSASSSAASSVSSINLAAGGSQSSISSNQAKVNRSASLTLQRTGSLKQQAAPNSSNNNSLPRRSKSIYTLTGTAAEKERASPQKTMSKEDVHQAKDNHLPNDNSSSGAQTRLANEIGQPMKERSRSAERSPGEEKSNEAKDKSNGRPIIDGNETSQLIQVTDQSQILIDELSSIGPNGNQDDGRTTPTGGGNNGSRSKVDDQSKKSNLTSPNVNKVTSSSGSDDSSVSPAASKVAKNDSHATSESSSDKVQGDQPSLAGQPTNRQAALFGKEDEQINEAINNDERDAKEDKKKLSDEEQLNLAGTSECDPNGLDANVRPMLPADRLDNELNKSEIDYLKQSNSKTGTSCEAKSVQQPEGSSSAAARAAKRTNEGGASAFRGGAQVLSASSAATAAQNAVRKEKLTQLKSNDQQVKKQINELIECVKKSEFLLSQTIDCQPLTIEIFDGLDDSETDGKTTEFNYAESTAVLSNSSANQKADNNHREISFLIEEAPSSNEQQPASSDQAKMNHVNGSAGAAYNTIVNNKILNSSKSSDLGGSSSAVSSSDESTSKSPDELDAVERAGLTRKDSVSSSSSSICSSSGSTSGVSSSHSGQFNSLNKAKNSTNDLLLLQTTNAINTTQTDKHQLSTNTPWIKTTLATNGKSPLQAAKYPPAFKRIEHSLKSLDEKSSPVCDFGKTEKHPINNEQLINKVTVDAGSAILNGNYL